jgi:hypothetical protein
MLTVVMVDFIQVTIIVLSIPVKFPQETCPCRWKTSRSK